MFENHIDGYEIFKDKIKIELTDKNVSNAVINSYCGAKRNT